MLHLASLADTRHLAQALATTAQPGACLLLSGNLGSGKTTLTQALGQTLGVEDLITSPTFTLLQEYPEARLPLYHCDLYRLPELSDWDDPAVADLELSQRADGILVIEWPQRLRQWPVAYLHLDLCLEADDSRTVTAAFRGAVHELWWQQTQQAVTTPY